MTARELPMETVRFWRQEFRYARSQRPADERDPLYRQWESVAHQAQWRVKELRREFPRARRRKVQEVAECLTPAS